MQKQINDKVKIDLRAAKAYLEGNTIAEEDIRRVIKKIKMLYPREQIHSSFETLEWQEVEPSNMPPLKCFDIYNQHIKKSMVSKHPVHVIDSITQKSDVSISFDNIIYEEVDGEVTKKSSIQNIMGMYSTDARQQLFATTATAIAHITHREDKGTVNVFVESKKCNILKVTPMKAIPIRSQFTQTSKSGGAARDEIYEAMYQKPNWGHMIVDDTYRVLPYKADDVDVRRLRLLIATKMREKGELNRKEADITGSCPVAIVRRFTFKDEVPLRNLYATMHVAKQTIGGNGTKRGALTFGYMYGEISSAWTTILLNVRTIMSFVKMCNINCVKLPVSDDYSVNLIRTLIRNGISVATPKGIGMCSSSSIVGHYRSTAVASFRIVEDPFTQVGFVSNGVEWRDNNFEEEFKTLTANEKGIYFAHVALTPKIYGKIQRGEVYTFPSLEPHECKVWITNKCIKNGTVDINRMCEAIYAKVAFPLTRRPYCHDDKYRTYFQEEVILPKITRGDTKLDESQYKVDCSMKITTDEAKELKKASMYSSIAYVEEQKYTDADIANDWLIGFHSCNDQAAQIVFVSDILSKRGDGDGVIKEMMKDVEFLKILDICEEIAMRGGKMLAKGASTPEPEITLSSSSTGDDVDIDLTDLEKQMATISVTEKVDAAASNI